MANTQRKDGIRWALVTGAAGGIGEEICKKLAARGLRIAACDIQAEKAERVASSLGSTHVGLAFDVSDANDVAGAFDHIEGEYGPISVVVCAAGLLLFKPDGQRLLIKSTSLELWERSFAVNMRGVFLCA